MAFPLNNIIKAIEMLVVGISKCKDQLLEILLCVRQYQGIKCPGIPFDVDLADGARGGVQGRLWLS